MRTWLVATIMERITGLKSQDKKGLINDKLAPDASFYFHIPAKAL